MGLFTGFHLRLAKQHCPSGTSRRMQTTEPNGLLLTATHPAASAATPYRFRWKPVKSPMPNTHTGITDSHTPTQRTGRHYQVNESGLPKSIGRDDQ